MKSQKLTRYDNYDNILQDICLYILFCSEEVGRMHHDEEIRLLAYHIWEDEGHPGGRQMEHWLKAETTMLKESTPQAAPRRTELVSPKVGGKRKH